MLSSSGKLLNVLLARRTAALSIHNVNATAVKGLATAAASRPSQTQSSNFGFDAEEVTILRLNNLQDNPGAVKKQRRVGRGIGSSKGKTCGKGHKGQKARNKSSIPTGFEGGQTKFYKVLPKKGFNNKRHRQKQGADMVGLNLGVIQDYIDMGRFAKLSNTDSTSTTTLGIVDFIEAGILKKTPGLAGVKLLAGGKERFSSSIRLEVNRASDEAIAAAEQAGAQVTTTHLNRLAMRALIRPDKFSKVANSSNISQDGDDDESSDDNNISSNSNASEDNYLLPKQARPPPKLQAYYTSWKNRGYLCPQVQMREWFESRPDLQEAFEAKLKIADEQTEEKKEVTEKE